MKAIIFKHLKNGYVGYEYIGDNSEELIKVLGKETGRCVFKDTLYVWLNK